MFKKSFLITAATILTMTGMASHSHAQDADAALQAVEDALPGTLMHNPLTADWESRGDDKKIKVVNAETPSGKAISARVKKRKQKPWDVVLWINLDDGVSSGDQIEMHFWARTAKAAKGKESAEFTVFVGRNQEPHDFIISESFTPDETWKLHTLKGVAKRDFGKGRVKVEYQIGKHAQTVEFGAVYVSNLGPAS